ncbi:MAG: hypothetical protein JSS02_04805 [Planctomycetes bacterium]|nr:hypothetical protein [Planctomycetota bacterium]
MDATYQDHGIQFRYPDDWELGEQQEADQFSVTVTSPTTAFWTLSLFNSCPEPDDVIESVLDAFHEEYDEMDEYPTTARVARRPTVGRDIDFVCLNTMNFAAVRSFRTRQFTAMVLFQLNESEREDLEPILEQITRSLSCAGASTDAAEDDDEFTADAAGLLGLEIDADEDD